MVGSRYALKQTEVSYWDLRMTLLAMSGLLVVFSFFSSRAAIIGTSVATLWLAMLATASLMIAPTAPLWNSPAGQGQPLIWGPLCVAAAHWVLCLASKAATSRFVEPFKNWVPIGIGVVLLWVAFGVCTRMVAGGWLLLTIGESSGQTAAKFGIYSGVVVAVFVQNLFTRADDVK